MSDQLGLCFDEAVQYTRPVRELPDVGRFHKNGTDTEKGAAEQAPVGTQRERVMSAFRKARELTDEECSIMARIRYPHVAGTRRQELQSAGVPIVDSGIRRQTTSHRLAIVWRLADG